MTDCRKTEDPTLQTCILEFLELSRTLRALVLRSTSVLHMPSASVVQVMLWGLMAPQPDHHQPNHKDCVSVQRFLGL